MVTLNDIAQACDVSRATVSKVMNGYDDISPQTKILIQKKAREMGYLPNLSARSLKTNRTYNIGILFSDALGSGFKHEYFINILNSFKSEAEQKGYTISFISDYSLHRPMTYLEQCRYRNFDGVMIACTDYEDERVVELVRSDLPTVTTDFSFSQCSAVFSDNVGGMQMLMDHILGLGHRRIAYIHGEMTAVTKQRLAVFYKSFEKFGLEPEEDLILEARYRDTELSASLTEELIRREDRPSCILYPDDFALIGGMNFLSNQNIRVPEDICIAGYDGSMMADVLKITTVYQNTEEIGRIAAEHLIDEIDHPKTWIPEQTTVPCRLVPGTTVTAV